MIEEKIETTTLTPQEVRFKDIIWGAFGNGKPEVCAGGVIDILLPKEGGIFTKYLGCNYLFKGYPDANPISKIAIPKKMVMRALILLNDRIVQAMLFVPFLIFLILPKKQKGRIIKLIKDYYIAISIASIHKVILKDERYKTAVKEIHRVLTGLVSKEERDIPCMILEYDYAYLARGQDVIPYLDKEKLKENPRKEILRILDILIERETSCLDKWKKAKKILKFLMLFKDVRSFLFQFFYQLDLEKIKPDEADWYYVLDRNDYEYGGLSREKRMEISKELDKKMGNKRVELIFEKNEKNNLDNSKEKNK